MMDHQHPHVQSPEVIRRLKRIEGHVRAVREMAEAGRPCAEVIHQIGAVEAALRRTANAVLADHLERCIANSLDDSRIRGLIGELKEALNSYVR
jgi:DNA-binding FrmR family transcriptional regulator